MQSNTPSALFLFSPSPRRSPIGSPSPIHSPELKNFSPRTSLRSTPLPMSNPPKTPGSAGTFVRPALKPVIRNKNPQITTLPVSPPSTQATLGFGATRHAFEKPVPSPSPFAGRNDRRVSVAVPSRSSSPIKSYRALEEQRPGPSSPRKPYHTLPQSSSPKKSYRALEMRNSRALSPVRSQHAMEQRKLPFVERTPKFPNAGDTYRAEHDVKPRRLSPIRPYGANQSTVKTSELEEEIPAPSMPTAHPGEQADSVLQGPSILLGQTDTYTEDPEELSDDFSPVPDVDYSPDATPLQGDLSDDESPLPKRTTPDSNEEYSRLRAESLVSDSGDSVTKHPRATRTDSFFTTSRMSLVPPEVTRATVNGKHILSLDGGAFNGIPLLLTIGRIMERLKVKLGLSHTPKPNEVFQLISTASGNSLVGLLLGRLGYDTYTAQDKYIKIVRRLFGADEMVFWRMILEGNNLNTEDFQRALSEELSDDLDQKLFADGDDTKVLINIACDAPYYNNHVAVLGSSRPRQGDVDPNLPDHIWTVRESIMASTAAKFHFSPFFVDHAHAYRDAAYSGCANPTQQALDEAESLWGQGEKKVVLSIGTTTSKISPPTKNLSRVANASVARRYLSSIPCAITTPSSQNRAIGLVQHLVTMASDAARTHEKVKRELASAQVPYYRLSPVVSLKGTALTDTFSLEEVTNSVNNWLNKDEVQNDINKLVDSLAVNMTRISESQVDLSDVRSLVTSVQHEDPPPPPTSTNTGYNPSLDMRRPSKLSEYFKNYHVIFIIDDSSSMSYNRCWGQARNAMCEFFKHAEKYTASIDLTFLNHEAYEAQVQNIDVVQKLFEAATPWKQNLRLKRTHTNIGAALKRVLQPHVERLDQAIDTFHYGGIPPLDVVVVTDGVPDDNPRAVLLETVSKLQRMKHHPNAIGIQVIQVGNDKRAGPALQSLKGRDVGNIIDATEWKLDDSPQLSCMRLEKILLSGIHPNIRAMHDNP